MPESNSSMWEVDLEVSGPISIRERQAMRALKGERKPFFTQIQIRKTRNGVNINVVARARSQQGASDAAAYFVGLALDVLSLRTDLPLYLNLQNPVFRTEPSHAKRIIDRQEWEEAFWDGQAYAIQRPTYSRALSWYRKGLTGENPIDQLLAFWAGLESIGSQFHEKNERTNQGTVNQICNCFDQLWGTVETWKVIPQKAKAINEFNDYRSKIAHGGMRVDVERIREINEELPLYKELVRTFLLDWGSQGIGVEYARQPASQYEPVE
jgi:hypothetical protein